MTCLISEKKKGTKNSSLHVKVKIKLLKWSLKAEQEYSWKKRLNFNSFPQMYCRRMLKYREIIRITNKLSGIYGKMWADASYDSIWKKGTPKYLLWQIYFLSHPLSLSEYPSAVCLSLSPPTSSLSCLSPFTLSNSVFLCSFCQSLSDSLSLHLPSFFLLSLTCPQPSLLFLSLSLSLSLKMTAQM